MAWYNRVPRETKIDYALAVVIGLGLAWLIAQGF